MGEFRCNDGVLVGDFVVPQLMAAIEVHVGGSGLIEDEFAVVAGLAIGLMVANSMCGSSLPVSWRLKHKAIEGFV